MDSAQKIITVLVVFLAGYVVYTEGGLDKVITKITSPKIDTVFVQTQLPAQQNNICNCTTQQVEGLAFKIIHDYTLVQDKLPSEMAKVMSEFGSPEKKDNCTWVVTFEISWPYGNTDGAHPDEFIRKHIACDGKEVYVQ